MKNSGYMLRIAGCVIRASDCVFWVFGRWKILMDNMIPQLLKDRSEARFVGETATFLLQRY